MLGENNDLIERICNDSSFKLNKEEIMNALKPENFIGRSKEQVEEYIKTEVDPILLDCIENISIEINV